MADQHRGWEPGDVAVCIDGARAGGWINSVDGTLCPGPETGQMVHVVAIERQVAFEPAAETGLEFAEFADNLYPASKFRRIEPDASTAADFNFTQAMRSLRRRVPA